MPGWQGSCFPTSAAWSDSQILEDCLELLPDPPRVFERYQFAESAFCKVPDNGGSFVRPKVLQDRLRMLESLEHPCNTGVVLAGHPGDGPGGLEPLALRESLVELRPGDRPDPGKVGLVLVPGALVDGSFGQVLGLRGQLENPVAFGDARIARGPGGQGTTGGLPVLSGSLRQDDQFLSSPGGFATRFRRDPN
jgi:hypothetical protein